MNNDEKVTLTFTVGEVKEMLLPLYESTIQGFDMMSEGVGYKIIRWRKADD